MIDYRQFSEDIYKVEVLEDRILVVTLDRPKALNSIPTAYHAKLDALWTRFEEDPSLRVAIITGKGKVFCAGADLKEWLQSASNPNRQTLTDNGGFLGISNRETKKPIIAALNGSSYGGGTEALINCDLAVAVASASISLPETRRGVLALAGALPRSGRHLGLKRAAELALVSEPISARTAYDWGLLNRVVDNSNDLMTVALDLARKIALGSPEAIQASLRGIRRGYSETRHSLVEATGIGAHDEGKKLQQMDNIKEGLLAFTQKRNPEWNPAKL
jgi:enoyl-CoA hydratase/carnithine racemase